MTKKEDILERIETIKSEYEITQELLKMTVSKLGKLADEYEQLTQTAKEQGIDVEKEDEK